MVIPILVDNLLSIVCSKYPDSLGAVKLLPIAAVDTSARPEEYQPGLTDTMRPFVEFVEKGNAPLIRTRSQMIV